MIPEQLDRYCGMLPTIGAVSARTLHPSSINEGKMIMKRLVVLGIVAVLFAGSVSGKDSKAATPEALKADIEALKATKVACAEGTPASPVR